MVRRMCEADLDQVARIERDIFSEPWSRDGFAASLADPNTLYLVAEADGAVAGYCGLLRSFDEADITNVAVRETYRKRGIGRSMLEELMKQAREEGVDRFTLEVRVSNQPAIELYQSLGFESVGIRPRFYAFPVEDAMIMWTK